MSAPKPVVDARSCSERLVPALGLLNAEQWPQPPRSLRFAQVAQCVPLDLPDPFPAQVELLGNLPEGMLAIMADPEPHPDHLLFAWVQSLEHARGFFANAAFKQRVHHRADTTILNQVA